MNIGSFFLDQEKKPKWINILFLTMIILSFTSIMLTKLNNHLNKNARGRLDINLDSVDENDLKPDQIILNKNNYLTKEELTEQLNETIPGIVQREFGEQLNRLDEIQARIIGGLEDKLDDRDSRLRNEMAELYSSLNSKISSGYEINLNNEPGVKLNNPPSNYNPSNPSNSQQSYYSTISDQTYYSTNPDFNSYVGSGIILDTYTPVSFNPLIVNEGEKPTTGYRVGKGVNSGTQIKAILETGCLSSSGKCPVIVRTLEDIYYENKIVIPANSYFQGFGQGDFSVRKIYITLEKLVIGKREIDVKAYLVDDKTKLPGFCSKYIDKTLKTLWTTFFMDFAAGWIQTYKDTIYIVTDDGLPVTLSPQTPRNAAIDGLTNGINSFSNKLASDAARMGYIIIVDQNLPCTIILEEKIPLEQLISG